MECLPADGARAILLGRAWLPGAGGPAPVLVSNGDLLDASAVAPTCSQLLELDDPVAALRGAQALPRVTTVGEALANAAADSHDPHRPSLLAPCDLQAVKASGVTFVASLLERVIEEQARGDAGKADTVRQSLVAIIGDNLRDIRPGSSQAARVKDALIAQGAWSQYLEVGIGPDAEIFTKAQPMSAVGAGAEIGVHPKSAWNNPEPEIGTRGQQPRPHHRRHARQRRQPARLRRAQRAPARQGEGQQRLGSNRTVHPAVRRGLHARHRSYL